MSSKSLALAALAGLGCGASEPPRRVVAPATEVLPEVPFAALDRDQRDQLMKTHVLPGMTPLFQRHDPTFQVVTCTTCHAEGDWTMPNRALAVLDLEDLSAHEPADVAWMKTEIVPAMRRLLRDPTLRCGRCHPVVGP